MRGRRASVSRSGTRIELARCWEPMRCAHPVTADGAACDRVTAARVSDNMVHKKLDNRIRILIENQVKNRHRSLFVVVGKKGREQVVVLHQMLSKAQVKARPTVLWCYKKELGFST